MDNQINDTPEVYVQHILSVHRQWTLQDRLNSDLSFAKYELRKDFHGFLKHSIRFADAFKIEIYGPAPRRGRTGTTKGGESNNGGGGRIVGGAGTNNGHGGGKTVNLGRRLHRKKF